MIAARAGHERLRHLFAMADLLDAPTAHAPIHAPTA